MTVARRDRTSSPRRSPARCRTRSTDGPARGAVRRVPWVGPLHSNRLRDWMASASWPAPRPQSPANLPPSLESRSSGSADEIQSRSSGSADGARVRACRRARLCEVRPAVAVGSRTALLLPAAHVQYTRLICHWRYVYMRTVRRHCAPIARCTARPRGTHGPARRARLMAVPPSLHGSPQDTVRVTERRRPDPGAREARRCTASCTRDLRRVAACSSADDAPLFARRRPCCRPCSVGHGVRRRSPPMSARVHRR